MISNKVIESKFSFSGVDNIINSIESCIALLKYAKPKPRSIIIPGNPKDLPDEIAGGLIKREATPEGVIYSTDDSGPGFQIEASILQDKYTTGLVKGIFEEVKQKHFQHTKEPNLPVYQHTWFFVNPPTEYKSNFHNHLIFNNTFPYDIPTYTWVYYLQLPNNSTGNEGKLCLKDKGKEYMLDIELETIYIFPSYLDHKAVPSPNSSVNRITLAGNILIPGSEKSLFSE